MIDQSRQDLGRVFKAELQISGVVAVSSLSA